MTWTSMKWSRFRSWSSAVHRRLCGGFGDMALNGTAHPDREVDVPVVDRQTAQPESVSGVQLEAFGAPVRALPRLALMLDAGRNHNQPDARAWASSPVACTRIHLGNVSVRRPLCARVSSFLRCPFAAPCHAYADPEPIR